MQKKFRLRKNYDFQRIINLEKKKYNDTFVVYYDDNQEGHLRLGITISKKNANAVLRNRVKRQVKSMLQKYLFLNKNQDIIIFIRKKYLYQTFLENEKKINELLKKIIL